MRAKQKLVQQISDMARLTFKDHQISLQYRSEDGRFASWRCQKPGTWFHGFLLTVQPGYLIVVGDLGDTIWCREHDMLAWARKTIDDVHYFAGKVVAGKVKEWDQDIAREWLDDEVHYVDEEQKKEWLDVRSSLLSSLEDGRTFFEMALYESGWIDGADWPDFKNWTYNYLWCREAVKWFLENLENVTI
jgi:hypothetical protein